MAEFYSVCAACETRLDSWFDANGVLCVEPCQSCLTNEFRAGYDHAERLTPDTPQESTEDS
jgi:hypothetical protein